MKATPSRKPHPVRLATIASLLGLRCALPDRSRILELGCSAGGNIIPMAACLPGSTFLGIDLSSVQIGQGEQVVRELGLNNIQLRAASIMDVRDELGKFHYIICHGVYSWVPDQVQERILDICARQLAPAGIAYISYNTYPGWHMRGMIRDMLVYHAQQFVEPQMKVKQARNLLDFLARSGTSEKSLYGMLLRQELESFQRNSDSYLYHEHLEEVNEPIYFHEFAERHGVTGETPRSAQLQRRPSRGRR